MQLKIHFKALETLVTTKIWTWHLQTDDQIPKIKTKHWACTEIDWEWFIRAVKCIFSENKILQLYLKSDNVNIRHLIPSGTSIICEAIKTHTRCIANCFTWNYNLLFQTFLWKNTVLLKNDKINTFKTVYNKIKLYWMNVYWWIIEQLILFKDYKRLDTLEK